MKSSSQLQSLLLQLKSSPYYSQALSFNLRLQTFQNISIKLPTSKDQQFIISPPQINILLNNEILTQVKNDLIKSKKSKNAIVIDYQGGKKHFFTKIHMFNHNQDQEDIGMWQQAEDVFCVGLFVQKEHSYQQYIKRITTQLRKCLEKKFQIIYAKNNKTHQSSSTLNQIQKILFKNFRIFLSYQLLASNNINSTRLMYYPQIKFLIKHVKLNPSKFTANKVYENALQFKNKYDYGYLSLSNNSKTKEIRFLLIDKYDPQLNQNPPPMIGIWIAVDRFQSKDQQKTYFWAVIMEYLRNPSLKIKLSVNHPNSGILFTIQRPQRITAYIFQIYQQGNCSGKWCIKYQSEISLKIPQQYTFSNQQIIFQQEKQQSDIQSIQNRSLMKNQSNHQNYQNNSYPFNNQYINHVNSQSELFRSNVQDKSVRSTEEKDLEIRFLKKELDFYKVRCQMLEKMVNNPTMMQFQAMQIMNQMAIPQMTYNPNIMYPQMQTYNQIPYQNPQNIYPQPPINLSQSTSSMSQSQSSKRVLNQSQLQQQPLSVPEPVPIKQLAFNKKKTFEQQKPQKLIQPLKNRKQQIKKQIKKASQKTNDQDTHQIDYKNISFAQDNVYQLAESLGNRKNKLLSYNQESQIYQSKSPSFKQFSNNQQHQYSNQKKGSNIIKNQYYRNSHQFSFDRKDQEFNLKAKYDQSKPSNQKNTFDDIYSYDQNFVISKFQEKYHKKQSTTEEKYKQQIKLTKSTKIEDTKMLTPKFYKQTLNRQQKIQTKQVSGQKLNSNNKSQKIVCQTSQRTGKRLPLNAIQKQQQNYKKNLFKNRQIQIEQKQLKQKQKSPVKTKERTQLDKSPALSRIRQPIKDSDSESDDEIKNIRMKYKK